MATIGGCDHASISIIRRRGGVQTVAPTDDVPVLVDAIQYDTGQDPCLNAIAEREVSVIDDMGSDERWPAFSRRAAAGTGVCSMTSFRLFVQGDTIVALNLYSRRPAAFAQLPRASQYLDLKLRELAAQVVETGHLPDRRDHRN